MFLSFNLMEICILSASNYSLLHFIIPLTKSLCRSARVTLPLTPFATSFHPLSLPRLFSFRKRQWLKGVIMYSLWVGLLVCKSIFFFNGVRTRREMSRYGRGIENRLGLRSLTSVTLVCKRVINFTVNGLFVVLFFFFIKRQIWIRVVFAGFEFDEFCL